MASAPTAHVPPQNLEAEESVLGAMLVAEPTLTRVIDEVKLNADDFYRERHAAIFTASTTSTRPPSRSTCSRVTEALTQRGQLEEVGGKRRTSPSSPPRCPPPGNAKHYARDRPAELAAAPPADGAAQQIQRSVHERDGEPRELVEQAEQLLFEVAHEEQAEDFREIEDILHDEVDSLEKLSHAASWS